MAEKLFPTRHRTLRELSAAGLHLHAFCNNPACRWNARLDTDELMAKLGPEHGTMPPDMVPVLVCSKCGSKDLAVIMAAGDGEITEETADHIREWWKSPE